MSGGSIAVGSPVVTPSPTPSKRSVPLPSPVPTTDTHSSTNKPTGNTLQAPSGSEHTVVPENPEPPKKKRRVALTRVADLSP